MEKLTCGHKGASWLTVLYPDDFLPYSRFCDVECMIHWHRVMRDKLARQLSDEMTQVMQEIN
jgi:hypothetical protein